MKKSFAKVLAFGTAIAMLAGSLTVTASADAAPNDTITVALTEGLSSMDPFMAMTGARSTITLAIYQTLGRSWERGADPELVLAKSVEQTGDTTFQVEIYDYIYDTAGNHITADDIAWCYNEHCLGTAEHPRLSFVTECKKVDDYTVEFDCTSVTVGALATILEECPIVSQAAYEAEDADFATNPIGTVGYKCTEFVEGSSYTLEYTGEYWQTDESLISAHYQHNWNTVKYEVIAEASQIVLAMAEGTVDITNAVSDDDLAKFQEGGEYADVCGVYSPLDNKTVRIYFCGSPENEKVGTNLALRQAICYAIDVDGINAIAYNGTATNIVGVGSSLCGDYDPSWAVDGYYDYDEEKALELLEESGYNGETLTICCNTTGAFQKVAQGIQSYLEGIGVNSEIEILDDTSMTTRIESTTDWDLYINSAGTEDSVVNDWSHWLPADSFSGHTQAWVYDDELQALYLEAHDANTTSQEVVNEAQKLIYDNAYVYGLCQNNYNIVYNTSTVGEVLINNKCFICPWCSTAAE